MSRNKNNYEINSKNKIIDFSYYWSRTINAHKIFL